jgi:hypothetical protein
MKIMKGYIFCTIMFLSVIHAQGQDKGVGIRYKFIQDTVNVTAGETFSNRLSIENNTDVKVKLVSGGSIPGQSGLLKLPDTIVLAAGQKRIFPLKYMANQQTIKNNIQKLSVKYIACESLVSVQPEAAFYAVLTNVQGLIMDTDQQEIYLDQLTNQARVMLRVFNNGLVPVSFRLELTEIPDGLDFIGETTSLTLKPGMQQSLPFIARNKVRSREQADFAVTIRALDVQNKQLSIKQLRIMSVSSDRRLSINNSPFYHNQPNTVALRYSNIGQGQSMFQLQGNGQYSLDHDRQLDYRLNMDYLNNPGQRGINLYDTFINYQSKSWGVKLGNINESLDFNLSGRGIKASGYLGNKRSIDVYGLNNNYLLYSGFNQRQQFGSTYAINYKEGDVNGDNKNLILLQSDNLWTGTKTSLVSLGANFKLDAHQQLGLEGGYSLQGLKGADVDSKSGGALGFHYNLNKEKLSLSSNNYYSTPYYDGLRKGLLQLDESISIRSGKSAYFSGRISLMHSNSSVFSYAGSEFIPLSSKYGNTLYELGYGNHFGKWNINVKPYYYTQYMQALNTGTAAGKSPEIWHSASARTTLNVNYSNSGHDVSLTVDQGYTFRNTTGKPPAPFYSSRMNLDYQNQVGGFTAFAQFNSYYLSDAIGISDKPDYSMYSFGPTGHFALVKAHITVNANALYSYYGYNHSNNYSVNSSIRWFLKGNWAISGDFYYGLSKRGADHQYNPALGIEQPDATYQNSPAYSYASRQVRIGVEKNFGGNSNSGMEKLEVICFEDRNGNGIRDAQEPAAPGILVKIDGLAAITNGKGMVRFTASKDRAYLISIVNDKGWSLLQSSEVFLNKNKKMEIALVKTEKLSGVLHYEAEKYKEGTPLLAGIGIKAVAESGLVFHTLTNEAGTFNLFLPENKYMVYVDTEGMPFSISNQGQNVEVKKDISAKLVFQYKDENRQVDIRHFK